MSGLVHSVQQKENASGVIDPRILAIYEAPHQLIGTTLDRSETPSRIADRGRRVKCIRIWRFCGERQAGTGSKMRETKGERSGAGLRCDSTVPYDMITINNSELTLLLRIRLRPSPKSAQSTPLPSFVWFGFCRKVSRCTMHWWM